MSAWRSENVRTRSGFRVMILSMFAEVKALTASLWRAYDVTGDADDAVLLASR
jgi:hypothetical protein